MTLTHSIDESSAMEDERRENDGTDEIDARPSVEVIPLCAISIIRPSDVMLFQQTVCAIMGIESPKHSVFNSAEYLKFRISLMRYFANDNFPSEPMTIYPGDSVRIRLDTERRLHYERLTPSPPLIPDPAGGKRKNRC